MSEYYNMGRVELVSRSQTPVISYFQVNGHYSRGWL